MKIRSTILQQRRRGFSLVEVTLAVAIAALGLITLLGLLPQGLAMSQKTSLMVTNSNIVEQIIRDLENAQFSLLPTSVVRKYFNNEGNEVTESATDISFVAEIDPRRPAALPKTETTQPYLKRVIIRVATASSASYQFNATNNRLSYVTYNHIIAKTR